jgi:hypothetical protein
MRHHVKYAGWLSVALLVFLPLTEARATIHLVPGKWELAIVSRRLHGTLVDHTQNHGADRRIWSEALCQKRDLYVYLPPCYTPDKAYPLMIWFHGFAQDEKSFVYDIVQRLDRAMACGELPPMIVAAPDGSLSGNTHCSSFSGAGSFFVNSKAGRYEDYVMQDVWSFLFANYSIRPEREAHVLAGVSKGGAAAYSLGMKYRDRVKVVIGVFPPLNMRWVDCHGRYRSHFDPDCWGWRTDFSRGHEVIGRFYGFYTVRLSQLIDPLYDRSSPTIVEDVAKENPIELIDRLGIRPGELDMYVCYGRFDEFNMAAQIESFVYFARCCRGFEVTVGYDPHGHHNKATALGFFQEISDWLRPKVQPYSPD